MASINLTKTFLLGGATASILMAGNFLTASLLTVPTILHRDANPTSKQDARLLSQWRHMYDTGKAAAFSFFTLSSASTLLAVYGLRQPGWGSLAVVGVGASATTQRLLTGIAVSAGFLPWTLLAMLGTNQQLFAADDRAKAGGEVSGARVRELMERWKVLNFVRVVFPLVGGLVLMSAL